MTELMLSEALGIQDMTLCFPPMIRRWKSSGRLRTGAIINLDDITHIAKVEEAVGFLPETMSCR